MEYKKSSMLKLRRMLSFVPSTRFKRFYREFKDKEFILLDIGCGNHSPAYTKAWFPKCKYYGLDKEIYNNDSNDLDIMEKFYKLDLAKESLSVLPDVFFDVIILSHVIEHLPNGLDVLAELSIKLKPAGKLYIEFPSVKSLSLPSMKGTLNFCDDVSHIKLYDLKDVANILLSHNMRIIKGGTRREWSKIILFPFFVIYLLSKGSIAGAFWDIMGFAEYIYAEKNKVFND